MDAGPPRRCPGPLGRGLDQRQGKFGASRRRVNPHPPGVLVAFLRWVPPVQFLDNVNLTMSSSFDNQCSTWNAQSVGFQQVAFLATLASRLLPLGVEQQKQTTERKKYEDRSQNRTEPRQQQPRFRFPARRGAHENCRYRRRGVRKSGSTAIPST